MGISKLPPFDVQLIDDVALQAWADSTKVTYGSGLLMFHIFCDKKGISEVDRAPASSTLLAAFVATLAGSYSGSAVSNYLSGVRAWHTIHGLGWALSNVETHVLLKGALSMVPRHLKDPPGNHTL